MTTKTLPSMLCVACHLQSSLIFAFRLSLCVVAMVFGLYKFPLPLHSHRGGLTATDTSGGMEAASGSVPLCAMQSGCCSAGCFSMEQECLEMTNDQCPPALKQQEY